MEEADIRKFGNCESTSSISNVALISWDIWETFWSLTKTNITEENQEILCHRENHEIYIGLARKRNYQEAFRICRSFGGHLPTPIR